MKRKKGFRIIAMICFAAGIAALLALLVMLLWNWLIPTIFVGGPVITYWQALGLMILAKILFGGLKPPTHTACTRAGKDEWKEKLRERINQADPEKKKKFLYRMHAKFHGIDTEEMPPEAEKTE
jgi:hypothetical protein